MATWPASQCGADQGLRLTECACWRSRARTGVAAMLMGWGEKSNHRKSALDGLRVDVSLAVSPWQARAEVLQLPLGFSPDKVPFHMVPKRHRQTDGFAVNNRFAEGQCAVCKGQGLPCMPSASCLISSIEWFAPQVDSQLGPQKQRSCGSCE